MSEKLLSSGLTKLSAIRGMIKGKALAAKDAAKAKYLKALSPKPIECQESISLSSLTLAEACSISDNEYGVPSLIYRCVNYVDTYGLNEVGVYRLSGSASAVAALRAKFEGGVDFVIDQGDFDSHAVTGVLKKYLRERKHIHHFLTLASISFSPTLLVHLLIKISLLITSIYYYLFIILSSRARCSI